jgi:hypothetical protein
MTTLIMFVGGVIGGDRATAGSEQDHQDDESE